MHRVILCFGFGGCMILCTRCRNHRRRRHWTTKYLLHPVATFVLLNLAGWHRPLKRVAKVIRVECGWPPALVHLTMLSPAAVTLGKPKRPAKLDRAAFLYIYIYFFWGGGLGPRLKGLSHALQSSRFHLSLSSSRKSIVSQLKAPLVSQSHPIRGGISTKGAFLKQQKLLKKTTWCVRCLLCLFLGGRPFGLVLV